MSRIAILLCCCASLIAADLAGAYRAWAQGRPAEALPLLAERATDDGHWAAWYDYGLAAAASGDDGLAVAALLKAHLLAPAQDRPLRALASLGREAPGSWVQALGPIADLAGGAIGLTLAALAGAGLGWALLGTHHRLTAGLSCVVCLLAMTPGSVARWHDADRALVATIRPSWLLDASGQPQRQLDPGTILSLRRDEPWEGRWLVATPGGAHGAVPVSDCGPKP